MEAQNMSGARVHACVPVCVCLHVLLPRIITKTIKWLNHLFHLQLLYYNEIDSFFLLTPP